MALSLMPAVGSSPGFLSPAKAGTVGELLEHVRNTPREHIKRDLLQMARHRPSLPEWSGRLVDDAALFAELCTGLRHLHSCLLAPYWDQFTQLLTADRTLRMQQLVAGGFEELLEQANPRWMRWKPPVLEVQMMSDVERDLYLEGQGLVLVPSMFCTRAVVTEGHHPAVSYPVFQDQRIALGPVVGETTDARADYDRVSALLGRTRALVLVTVAEHEDCTTKELATRAGIAPASASEHATVLRGAGLVRSLRHRNFVLHGLTPLGLALLNNSEQG